MLLIPLTFALFTPLAVPAFAWWAAALNSLPMLAALAWVCADAILLVRTGNQRYAVTGAAGRIFGGLLFFEKAAVIPFVAFTVAALLAHVTGDRLPSAAVWRRGVRLWVGVAGADGRVGRRLSRGRRSAAVELRPGDDVGPVEPLGHSRHRAGSGRRTVGLAAVGAGVAVGDAAAGGDGAGLGGAGGAWSPCRWSASSASGRCGWWPLGYAVACQVPIYLMRSSRFTALELAQTLRYLPDLVVVLALLAAVGLCAPNRARSRWLDASPAAYGGHRRPCAWHSSAAACTRRRRS